MPESSDYLPSLSGSSRPLSQLDVDTVFMPVFDAEPMAGDLAEVDLATGGELSRARSAREFRAALYDTFAARVTAPGWASRRVIFIGAGKPSEADALRIRRVAAAAGYTARRLAITTAAFVVRGVPDAIAAAGSVADGLGMTAYDMGQYKQRTPAEDWRWASAVVSAPGADEADLTRAVRQGGILAEAANFTRALAHEPGNILYPEEFAARVRDRLSKVGLSIEVLDEDRMAMEGMRLLMAVGKGSARAPRLVVIRYEPQSAPQDRIVGLVGKGVTFDTGGISLKPAADMERMKGDMAGGAAVAGAMLAIARLGGPKRVVAVIPMAENMPGRDATRPGDVVRGASGKTVEVINTDAEGRLILADALWYIRKLGATHVIDVATLTGACVVALGHSTSGLFGNDDAWIGQIRATASRVGDRLWPMPIYEEALDQLKSEIADLSNSGGRVGGAVTAAAFLRAFAGEGPWAHLDIAGTAWADKPAPYQAKGATGVAVRLLTALGMAADPPGAPSAD